jgi:glycerol-3-phosphate acyltransferase PlsY
VSEFFEFFLKPDVLFLCLFSYLLGSIQFGVLIGKLTKGINILKYGSKSSGATNATRVLGLKYGIITTILDILKGLIPIVISCFMFDAPSILAGLFAVLGHIFPIYNKFKGGKGVATTAGVNIAIDPISAIFGFIIMVLIVSLTRYVSLASITVATLVLGSKFFSYQNNFPLENILFLIILGLIIYRHKDNIKRLIKGTERKFGEKVEVK